MSKVHPVYGLRVTRGFSLTKQLPITLDFWHDKASKLAAKATDPDERAALERCRRRIFAAAMKAKVTRASDVARQIEVLMRECAIEQTGASTSHVQMIGRNLVRVTQPIAPQKLPGDAVMPNGRLTQTGVLIRYLAFLVEEAKTISWHLYGERDYAFQFQRSDHEVNKRCRRKARDPFFDEATLPRRARAVLGALRVGTRMDEDSSRRTSKKTLR